jgi:hypothetical protein
MIKEIKYTINPPGSPAFFLKKFAFGDRALGEGGLRRSFGPS